MKRNFIKNDLVKQFQCFDDDTEFMEGLLRFIDESTTDVEIDLLHDHLTDMVDDAPESVEEFIELYQPLFDIVDIDLADVYKFAKQRKDLRKLDF